MLFREVGFVTRDLPVLPIIHIDISLIDRDICRSQINVLAKDDTFFFYTRMLLNV